MPLANRHWQSPSAISLALLLCACVPVQGIHTGMDPEMRLRHRSLSVAQVATASLPATNLPRRAATGVRASGDTVAPVMALRGGVSKKAKGPAPDVASVIAVGSICGAVLVLNEMGLLALVLRVSLTFTLAVLFLLAGVNKTFLNATFSSLCGLFPGFGGLAGREGDAETETFKLTGAIADRLTPGGLMRAVGLVEMWSAMFLLISLAGTGSRGHRVPLAEVSNVVLLVLMVAATYTHVVLKDGQFLAPAVLAVLLTVRLLTPPPVVAPKQGRGVPNPHSGMSRLQLLNLTCGWHTDTERDFSDAGKNKIAVIPYEMPST